MHKPLQIIKLGGSLLKLADLPERLEQLIQSQPQYDHAIVVGGGGAANVVREWDRVHQLRRRASHDLAVHSLQLTARFLTELIPASGLANRRDAVRIMIAHGRLPVIDMVEFLDRYEAEMQISLPHDWSLTSDSLALWVSSVLKADSLLLAKSISCPTEKSLDLASANQSVDEHFPWLWRDVKAHNRQPGLQWANLRSEIVRPISWDAQAMAIPPVLPQQGTQQLRDEAHLCHGLSW